MNKIALVTGSAKGIGAAIATKLSEQGYKVVINSIHSEKEGTALAHKLGQGSYYIQADISQKDQCVMLMQSIENHYGQLDVLVNNAAFASPFIEHKNLAALDEDLFLQNFNVNVLSAFRLAKMAVPLLQASDNANVINISSIAGLKPVGSSIAYAVSKAALNHLTTLLAKALAPKIRVNAVAPGVIETSRVQGGSAQTLTHSIIDKTLMRRAGKVEEIAQAVDFILKCHYLTGEIISVDGGYVLS